jgi:hypothetical protein
VRQEIIAVVMIMPASKTLVSVVMREVFWAISIIIKVTKLWFG